MPTGMAFDQMTPGATLEQAAEIIGYDALREQQRAVRDEGRCSASGSASTSSRRRCRSGSLSTEAAIVRVGTNGQVDVAHSGASHGQSLETTMAQVVADELGVDIDDVAVVQGDTDTTPFGPAPAGAAAR